MSSKVERETPRRWAVAASLTLIGLVYVWFWSVISHRIAGQPWEGFAKVFVTGCGDFEHFYLGARALRDGTDLYASGVHGYIYPPLIAFLFTPLTFFSVQTAAWIVLVINLALGLVCTWVLSQEVVRRLDIDDSFEHVIVVMALTTLLAAPKLRSELQMWQTNLLLMTALVFALKALDTRPWLAGLLLGFAFNIKYLPILFLPYLLLRRRHEAAGWFVAGIGVFALLPALVSGWSANLANWAVALSGIARLLGVATAVPEAANVDPISVGHSISVTSGLSRLLGENAPPSHAMGIAACVAIAMALLLRWIYVDRDKPLFAWPAGASQGVQPYRGMVALEWAALMALALAFSPQTNPRHASMLMLVFAPLAAILCFPGSKASRWPALAATAILFFGLAFPPNTPEFARQLAWWRLVGGAGWAMLLMLPFYFAAGFAHLAAVSSCRETTVSDTPDLPVQALP